MQNISNVAENSTLNCEGAEKYNSDVNIIFLDTKEVAKFLGCSVPTARQIMYRQDFPLIKVGKNLRVEKTALKKWAQHRHI